ncbi:MAG: galactose-1-phosphate uridylyltransferase [Actinomycetota bacterium]|jgi:UDPglucose--hexose-1-phosphate uridylyltransferase
MTELRLDPLSGRWVVISEARAKRPEAFELRGERSDHDSVRPCPFCPGHEEDTPPALETYGPEGNWLVRVVPNLYPAFEGDTPFIVENRGPVFTGATAGGIHEVLIFSPDHQAAWADISERQAALIMEALRDRIEAHSQSPHLRYTQAIVNSGREAGASLSHPHGQLLGMSFVPRELAEEQARFQRFVGGCLLCTTIEAEEAAGSRIITADDHAIALAPYWSSVPFEVLILPRHHGPHLSSAPHETLAAVGRALRTTLRQLRGAVGDVAYNIVFHSAPYRLGEPFHWHAHLWPKATTRAGFEMGTGVAINIVAPEAAAAELLAQEV